VGRTAWTGIMPSSARASWTALPAWMTPWWPSAQDQGARPEAAIYILGYPELFSTAGECGLLESFFDRGERDWLNLRVRQLNQVIGDAARDPRLMPTTWTPPSGSPARRLRPGPWIGGSMLATGSSPSIRTRWATRSLPGSSTHNSRPTASTPVRALRPAPLRRPAQSHPWQAQPQLSPADGLEVQASYQTWVVEFGEHNSEVLGNLIDHIGTPSEDTGWTGYDPVSMDGSVRTGRARDIRFPGCSFSSLRMPRVVCDCRLSIQRSRGDSLLLLRDHRARDATDAGIEVGTPSMKSSALTRVPHRVRPCANEPYLEIGR